ncbi:type I DNA topoisomerase [Zophobihabitans entericus]|uniref:DNA topoisomerase 1 n=1 Tax=Zophobihabitans entericus TaxID=1635327 RepID=A0A6G9IBY3_9GAMM|nr:type I DNA topoisomerase [Zophobihabitans entericus]QIQ21224.1 type I DNA topoisomerase [Zophobihabitans entericus]
MGKSLVIVESPAKAKTINKYLGKEFVVKSSVGHIRDLPVSGTGKRISVAKKDDKAEDKKTKTKRSAQQALVDRMGVDPYNDWNAHYEILPGKERVVSELKKLAKDADTIYLATDLDREGEAIAWHLKEVIGGDESKYRRVVFNEITKTAIQNAFKEPNHLDINRVNAQQARRFMDRVVGFMLSPLLWKKVARGLSAGRVQSVAVRLVVEREREIRAFIPEEFWELHADLLTAKQPINMQVTHFKGEAYKPVNRMEIDLALELLDGVQYQVTEREDKPTKSNPGAPFITSTLQQAASTRLGFGVKKTMLLAQRLYEAGYITYMRTDSTNLSQDAITMARGYIGKKFGDKYLPKSFNIYSSKQNSQEAHEAIRPSDVNLSSEQIKDVEADAKKLYQLIWQQFVACQMTPAEYDSTTLTVKAGDFLLKAKGRTLRFDGWTKVQPALRKNDEDNILPPAAVGDKLTLVELLPSQHFTKPAARYNEASLVKELEKRGIGRPSTYATIISTIQDRGYVRLENRRFYAEKIGEIVTDRLTETFDDLMSYDFTARMEDELDDVATKKTQWKAVLDAFFGDFNKHLEQAEKDPDAGGMRLNQLVPIPISCPNCSRQMGIKTASSGVFLACTGYSLPPKERCKQTINLIPEHEALNILEDTESAETNALRARRRCTICNTAMDTYLLDGSRKLHICGNNPICEGFEVEEGNFKVKGYEGPIVECDKCGSDMHLKSGRFGIYMGCTNPDCKNTRKILKNGDVAPPKEDPVALPELKTTKSDAYFVLRDGAAGIFLAANTFPKSRETRAPLVEELIRFKDRLPAKYEYLTQAPTEDPDGNKAVVRFSRKNKEQYVTSEKNGKATSWALHYVNGKWVSTKAK